MLIVMDAFCTARKEYSPDRAYRYIASYNVSTRELSDNINGCLKYFYIVILDEDALPSRR